MRVARAREKSASFFYFYRKMAGSHISSYSPAKLSPNKAKTSKRNRLKKTNKKRRRRQRVYIYGRKSVRSTYAICKKRSNMKKERRQKKKKMKEKNSSRLSVLRCLFFDFSCSTRYIYTQCRTKVERKRKFFRYLLEASVVARRLLLHICE